MENRKLVEKWNRRYAAGLRGAVRCCEAARVSPECQRKTLEGKPAVCRSAFMSKEEIERERELSGWNPYVGEEEGEEDAQRMAKMRDMKESAAAVSQDMKKAAKMQGTKKSTAAAAEKGGLPGTAEEDACQCQTCAKPGEYLSGAGCPLPRADYMCMLESLEQGREEESDLRRLQTMYPAEAKRLLPFIEDACDRMEYGGSMMFDEHPDPVTISRLQDEISGKSEILSGFAGDPESAGALIRVLLLQEMHRRRSRHRRIAGISG